MKIPQRTTNAMVIALLGTLLGACQSARNPVAPLETLAIQGQFEVLYEGSIGDQSPHTLNTPQVESMALQSAIDSNAPAWSIQTASYKIDRDTLNSLLGTVWTTGNALQGWVVKREHFEKHIQRLTGLNRVEVLTAPRLECFEDRPVHVAVVNQSAYIKHFKFARIPAQMISDPEVAVMQTGHSILFIPTQGKTKGSGGLSVEITHNSLLNLVTAEAEYPANANMSLQLPVCLLERQKATVELAPDQLAVFPPRVDQDGLYQLAVVHLRPVELPIQPGAQPGPNQNDSK